MANTCASANITDAAVIQDLFVRHASVIFRRYYPAGGIRVNNATDATTDSHASFRTVPASRGRISRQVLALMTATLIGLGGDVMPITAASSNTGTVTPIQHL